ncbi:MAG: DUF222 domain-containing protein [Geodermatophilaceae bacterium]|nr:DUF222 domain-containing protein [Geodermatophilaceae bacterium]
MQTRDEAKIRDHQAKAFGKREFTLSPDPYGSGGKVQIRVPSPCNHLADRIGVGVLDDGAEISPTLARMLACDAGIIPAVLDGHGQPLDLGRERRLFTGGPRTVIEIRDGGCVWPGCGRPTAWCQIHTFSRGAWSPHGSGKRGPVRWHRHREIEHGEWEAFHHRGRIWLRPPARIEPNRRPRINLTHRPPRPRHDWPPGASAGPAP